MISSRPLLALLPFVALLDAGPVERRQAAWNPYSPCKECFRSSWTQGPECKTDEHLTSTLSRILNPPASATSTYTPTKWCTDYLRQTDWSTTRTTTSMMSTYTSQDFTEILVTKTDLDHPTSTMYCPIPSPGMECGYDSNTIAPIEQGEDWSIEHYYNPEECQQVCLEHPNCKAYRIETRADAADRCEIFNVPLGKNGSNMVSPTPNGYQWWDRDCQMHIPTACRSKTGATAPPAQSTALPPILTTTPVPPIVTLSTATPAQPSITTAPTALPRAAGLSKRDAPLPPYLSDLNYFWSGVYVTPACSCLISSALPPVLSTTTQIVTIWTASTTITTTYSDRFTVTTTPRETTVYVSVN